MTRTACAWFSGSAPARWLPAAALLLSVAPAGATSYVPITDADLADQASLVVEARVLEAEPAPVAGRPATDYRVDVVRNLQGEPPANPLVVRVPGGTSSEGAVHRVWGAPELEAGERVILFLGRRGDGTFGIQQLMLGVFRPVRGDGRTLAVRDLSGARAVPRRGVVEPERRGLARDWDRFADWLEERGSGIERPGRYLVEAAPGERPRFSERYTLLQSGGQAFRWFNGGGTWYAHEAGQGGMAGGGFSEFRAALAAWSGDPGSDLSLSYGGTTSRTGGFRSTDGANVILFDDPHDEITGSFSCSAGGVLAIGGFSAVSGSGAYKGETFWRIVEGEVVTQDGAGCFFAGNDGKNGELVFAHEVGHALGLGHSCGDNSSPSCSDPELNDALMRAYAHNDGRGARLGADDRAALAHLYGDGGGGSACEVPEAPSGLVASAVSSSRIDLTWTDRATDETAYRVDRRASGTSVFVEISRLGPGARSFTDTGLAPGSAYAYRVRTEGCGGASSWAGPVSATTEPEGPGSGPEPEPDPPPPPPPEPEPGPEPDAPPAPTGVEAQAPSATEVVLAWTDRSGGSAPVHVEVRTGAAFQEARVVPAGTTETSFRNLKPERTYAFRLRARNGAGFSAYSPVVTVTTASAEPVGTLTGSQVACDARRLAGLLERLALSAPAAPRRGTGVNLSLTGTGDFAGIAYAAESPGLPERQLTFSTNPEETTLLRNPERPQLFAVSLSRNHLSSDLVPAGDPGHLRLVLDPTLAADPTRDGAGLLALDNLAASTEGATAARPGRGLAGLVEPCHDRLTPEDVHVLRVLSRIVRARVEGARSYETALYRARARDTYRIDVFPKRGNGTAMGRLALELAVTYGNGALATGTARVLPRCAAGQDQGCTTVTAYSEVIFREPALEPETGDEAGARVVFLPASAQGDGETVGIDWMDLLSGSTWRRALAGSGGALQGSMDASVPEPDTLAGPLPAAAVRCDGERLAGFLERLEVQAPASAAAPGVNLSYTRSGDFAGIAVAGDVPGPPAGAAVAHLAFSTNPEETTLLRNPERPQLFAVSLSRNPLNSDLVAPGGTGRLRLALDPALTPPGSPAGRLVLDNTTGPGGGSTDARPGRGLAPLVEPCHGPFRERDVHVFRVLSKLIRARTDGAVAHRVAIYRAAEPDLYRVDVYPQGPGRAALAWGRLAAEVAVGFGPGDELRNATLRVLPRCGAGQATGCTDVARPTEILLVPPSFGDAPQEDPAARVPSAASGSGTSASVDLRGLLAGTTWKRPL